MNATTRNLVIPLVAAIAIYLLWNTWIVYPLKIFVVFLHELSHGIAAIITGGEIDHIELSFRQGGVCYTRGGFQFVILSAGYLGSLLWGAALLVLSSRTRLDRQIIAFLGGMTLLVTLIYVRSWFGFAYGIFASAAFLVVAFKLSSTVSDVLVKVIGIVSCLYAVWDIASDVLFRNIPTSDANALARITFIPGIVWGILWILIALVITALALRIVMRASVEPQERPLPAGPRADF